MLFILFSCIIFTLMNLYFKDEEDNIFHEIFYSIIPGIIIGVVISFTITSYCVMSNHNKYYYYERIREISLEEYNNRYKNNRNIIKKESLNDDKITIYLCKTVVRPEINMIEKCGLLLRSYENMDIIEYIEPYKNQYE